MIDNFYDTTITFNRPSGSLDTGGNYNTTDVEIITVSGTLQALTGDERYGINDKKEEYINYKIYCTYTDLIQENDTAVISNTEYDVRFIDNTLRNNNHLEIDVILRK